MRNQKPHILIVTAYLPYPLTSGGAVRVYNLLKRLGDKYAFHLLSFIYSNKEREFIPNLQDFCETVDVVSKLQLPRLPRWHSYLRYAAMGAVPDVIADLQSEEMAEKIRQVLETHPVDIIQIEFTQMAQYLPTGLLVPSILVEEDIFFETLRKRLGIPMRWNKKMLAYLEWAKMRRYELQILPCFTKIITMSDHDADLLKEYNPKLDVAAIPNGVDTGFFRGCFDASTEDAVIFVGNFVHFPNVDGLLYFVREIWPKIRETVPGTKLMVVGNSPSEEVRGLASHDILVEGGVPDVRPYYAEAAVCVIPLRIGSGTRLKLLEALASGVPVVTTSVGAEGLEVKDAEHCFIRDLPEDFAAQVVTLLENRELRMKFSQNGRRLVESRYDWDAIAEEQDRLYSLLLGKHGQNV